MPKTDPIAFAAQLADGRTCDNRVVVIWPRGSLMGDSGGRDPEVLADARSTEYGCDHPPCPHARQHRAKTSRRQATWTVPYAIVVYTQGGHDCTVMCAACVADAVAHAQQLESAHA